MIEDLYKQVAALACRTQNACPLFLLCFGLQRIVFTARKPVRPSLDAEEMDGQRLRILNKGWRLARLVDLLIDVPPTMSRDELAALLVRRGHDLFIVEGVLFGQSEPPSRKFVADLDEEPVLRNTPLSPARQPYRKGHI